MCCCGPGSGIACFSPIPLLISASLTVHIRKNCLRWLSTNSGSSFFKPYRIIYRVERRTVYPYLIADGRCDMQTLLSRRLLDT